MNVSGNYRIGDIRHNYADINLIKEAIGFVPKITLEEGLQKFTNWVLTQSVNANSYEKSLDELKQRGLLK